MRPLFFSAWMVFMSHGGSNCDLWYLFGVPRHLPSDLQLAVKASNLREKSMNVQKDMCSFSPDGGPSSKLNQEAANIFNVMLVM